MNVNLAVRTLTVVAILALAAVEARAQLFGQRQLGTLRSMQRPPGAMTNPATGAVNSPGGTITGAERFVRGARQSTDFIGTDSGDRRGFVGLSQSRARRVLPVAPLQARPEPNVNQAGSSNESNSAAALYPSRLALSPELTVERPAEIQASLERRLRNSPRIRWTSPLELTVDGQTAILRGEVATSRDRELAEAWAEFEPGISDVQNDLTVMSPDPSLLLPAGRESLERGPAIPPGPRPRAPREF